MQLGSAAAAVANGWTGLAASNDLRAVLELDDLFQTSVAPVSVTRTT